MKRLSILIALLLSTVAGAYAQCAMCRATLENNVSNGEPGIAAGINFGILYLFFAPYLAVGVVAFFWYKTTKSNARKDLERHPVLR
ncbi:MAG TPA: hypothetical protein PKN99_10480 [Cyclobacteriaceae bacterium]|jgi:hypothetical protein|nr:hypothetical protein [Cyclobacteriaceae bacterium]HRK54721.1 hypothetical protein [Cyclobacteriaceae bacterium]